MTVQGETDSLCDPTATCRPLPVRNNQLEPGGPSSDVFIEPHRSDASVAFDVNAA